MAQTFKDEEQTEEGVVINCLYHEDNTPSLHVSLKKRCYHCFGCNAKGTLLQLASDIWNTAPERIKKGLKLFPEWEYYKDDIGATEASALKYLKGLELATVQEAGIGYDYKTRRYTLPRFNDQGKCIQLWKYQVDTKKQKFLTGNALSLVYPKDIEGNPVYLMEGQWDCLLARQNGLNAYTIGSASARWQEYWNVKDKTVIIVYDNDIAGIEGANKLALSIVGTCKEIKILKLPIEGDFSEWMLSNKGTMIDFANLIEDTEIFIPDTKAVLVEGSLKELIASFHKKTTSAGVTYGKRMVPSHVLCEAVAEWFKQNQGAFFWDKIGYLRFKGTCYNLETSNSYLRSMLLQEGGISRETAEGRIIIDSLVHCSSYAMKQRLEHWIAPDPKDPFCVYLNIYDEKTLKLTPGNIELVDVKSIPILQSERHEDFQSFEYNPKGSIKEGLDLLFSKCVNHFTLNTIQRELVICWLITALVSHFSTIKPGMRIKGLADAGKSTVLRLLFWFFFGSSKEELPMGTLAGLWRRAIKEPILFIDNLNVSEINEGFRTFFDLASTGGERIVAATRGQGVTTQRAHTLVLMTGLDTFPYEDVISRYIEVEASISKRGDYFKSKDKQDLIEARPVIMNSVLKLIAYEVLPAIQKSQGRYTTKIISQKLKEKSRIGEYLSLMLIVAKCIKKYSTALIRTEYLEDLWIKEILTVARKDENVGGVSLDWWKSFHTAITKNIEVAYPKRPLKDGLRVKIETHPHATIDFLAKKMKSGHMLFGVRGTSTELLGYLRWTARMESSRLPWANVRKLGQAYRAEHTTWELSSWTKKRKGNLLEITWPTEIWLGDLNVKGDEV